MFELVLLRLVRLETQKLTKTEILLKPAVFGSLLKVIYKRLSKRMQNARVL